MPAAKSETKLPTQTQTSAGGVAFRDIAADIEIAIIKVAPEMRWQLPKGLVDEGESNEAAALREVSEETGIEADLIEAIDTIEYWFVGQYNGPRTRFHKFVHFFLMRYRGGDVRDHDHEVEEARWVSIDEAVQKLAFKSEKDIVEKARGLIASKG
jgi:8-oxo-dGTP pyrophosphatase MutT (NUDIX family)